MHDAEKQLNCGCSVSFTLSEDSLYALPDGLVTFLMHY